MPYILLNRNLLQDMVARKIGKDDAVYYMMKNGLIDNYYLDINEVPGLPAGVMTTMELSRELAAAQFI
ncbi:hypothetical protein [Salinicoccus roseus]|uniref:hypothetical protein n=1 Tax=Salinicoccus roseus TaxID=45670 RepID=UPI001EF4D51B|nr:hypothetical protein [Salinicoccus roseus]MCG7332146.1 hypothetical protein [Salinicoccus roseus]